MRCACALTKQDGASFLSERMADGMILAKMDKPGQRQTPQSFVPTFDPGQTCSPVQTGGDRESFSK